MIGKEQELHFYALLLILSKLFKNWFVRQKLGGDHRAVNGMRKKRSFITKLDLLI